MKKLLANLRQVTRHDQLILSALAVLIGAAAAYGAIGFRLLIDLIQGGLYGGPLSRLSAVTADLAWWHILLAPALGGLAIGLFFRYVVRGGNPQSIAHVIEASAMHGGRMSSRTGIGVALASAASIGVGASVGREGPVVHLGATVGATVARRLGLSRSLSLTLLGCGVAAAVAASFNAPIAGVVFALEVVIGHYGLGVFLPIVIASVVGTIVTRIHIGDFPAFIIGDHRIASFLELPGFVVLGLACALMAILFMRATFLVEDIGRKAPVPAWSRPMFAGLAVGAIALVFPQILGVGYEATDMALKEELGLWLLLGLMAAKTAATALCLGGGFGGGVFSPSLFIGAMLGGAFGIIAGAVAPEFSSGPAVYTIVGMGAVAAAVLGAPISTTFMVFELTGDYALTLAVMIAVAVATVITVQVHGHSFFSLQLARRGVSLKGEREISLLRARRVRDIMKTDFLTAPIGADFATVKRLLQDSPMGDFLVILEEGRLYGLLRFSDVKSIAFDPALDRLLNAGDVAHRYARPLAAHDDLEVALRRMEKEHEDMLPVVADLDGLEVVGVIHNADVMRAYNHAILRARAEERGER